MAQSFCCHEIPVAKAVSELTRSGALRVGLSEFGRGRWLEVVSSICRL
jgi:hypothetical protein